MRPIIRESTCVVGDWPKVQELIADGWKLISVVRVQRMIESVNEYYLTREREV